MSKTMRRVQSHCRKEQVDRRYHRIQFLYHSLCTYVCCGFIQLFTMRVNYLTRYVDKITVMTSKDTFVKLWLLIYMYLFMYRRCLTCGVKMIMSMIIYYWLSSTEYVDVVYFVWLQYLLIWVVNDCSYWRQCDV